jgi:hypothetical protein
VIALPSRSSVPRFDVGGPAIIGDLAVVASSQFGFLAFDYRSGQLAWARAAGAHVAPPLIVDGTAPPFGGAAGQAPVPAVDDQLALIGECASEADVPAGERLLGCLRIVTRSGADQALVAIHGRARDVDDFAREPGTQHTWSAAPHAIRWKRGERAVDVDTLTGVATAAPADDPPLVVRYKGHVWQIARDASGAIVAREPTGAPGAQHGHEAWRTEHPYSAIVGAVYLPGQSPMVRVSNAGAFRGEAELTLLDIDATGSLHGQVAFPVPGIGLLAHAIDSVGNTALAVRLDASLERDFIVGYAANALLMWVYPLPRMPRADPIGIAVAPDAVVVFHDGDTLTVLPELSAPPTAPGAVAPPWENPTP